MAQLTINVPDALVPRLIAAHGVANAAGLKAYVIAQLKAKLADYEAEQAVVTARDSARTQANTDAGGIS